MIVRELVTLLRYQVDRAGLTEYAKKARTVGQQVGAVGRQAMGEWRLGVRDALTDLGFVPGKARLALREQIRLNAAQRQSARNIKQVGGGYTSLAGMIRNMAGAYLGFQGIKGFLLAGDEFGQTASRLKNATSSAEEYLMVDKALQANSRESYKPFAANADLFIRTNDVLKAMGKTTQDTLDVVSAANLSLAASGADAQKAASFVDQFGKAMGLGKLTGDAFQSMLANNQTMIKYLVAGLQETAPALGATTANLQQLVAQGKITTDRMIPALRSQIGKMRRDVEEMPVAIGDAMTVLRDQVARLSWNLNVNYGTIKVITKSLEFMANNLGQILQLLFMLGSSFAFMRMRMGLTAAVNAVRLLALRFALVATRVGLVRAGMLFLARAGKSALWPFLRMYAIIESIRLIGDDVLTWLRGGRSVLGGIIGRSEEWKTQVDWVKGVLESVKNLIGDASMSTAEFAKKWGTVGILILGVGSALKSLMGPVVALGRAILMRIVAPLVGVFFAAFGWPGIIAAALVAIVALMVTYWDDIERIIKGVWDNAVKYFTDKWDAALKWLGDKLKAVLPDGWVVSQEDAQKQRDVSGATDPRNPYAGRMGLLQRGGAPNVNAQDNRQTNITIQGVPGNPAAVGRAAEDGVRRGFGASGSWTPGYAPPNAEAMP